MRSDSRRDFRRAFRSAQMGLLVNTLLAIIKFVAGVVGNTYALIADAVESTADIFSSLIVLGGLRISSQPADKDHPYGHGRAESLAGAVVALMLLAAALLIAREAIHEIRTPHNAPAPWTLIVLVGVIITKETLFRYVFNVGSDVKSRAVMADAHHHRSDAITSLAAFIGIGVAVLGGPGWETADDWAALVASGVIFYNGIKMLRPALDDLMDRVPDDDLIERVSVAAVGVDEVQAVEKVKVRKVGLTYFVDIHAQSDPEMSLHDAHIVSGKVKTAIRTAEPSVEDVLVHMEPFEDENGTA